MDPACSKSIRRTPKSHAFRLNKTEKVTEETAPRTHHKHSQILHSSEPKRLTLRRWPRNRALNRTREQNKAKSLADAHFRGSGTHSSSSSERYLESALSPSDYSVHPTVPARAEVAGLTGGTDLGARRRGTGRSDTATSSSGGRASRRRRSDGGRPRRTPPPPRGGAIPLSFSGYNYFSSSSALLTGRAGEGWLNSR